MPLLAQYQQLLWRLSTNAQLHTSASELISDQVVVASVIGQPQKPENQNRKMLRSRRLEKNALLDPEAAIDFGQATPDDVENLQSRCLFKILGHGGLWQAVWCFTLSIFQGVSTFHIFVFVFQTADKEFWCAPPDEMQTLNASIWRNMTRPLGACSVWDLDYGAISSPPNLTAFLHAAATSLNRTECTTFEFDSSDGEAKTLVQEFGLVCGRSKLLSVVEMCFLAGAAIGSVSSGWISDKFGRKHTLMAFALLQTTFGTLLAFVPSLAMYMALRVVVGFASMTVAVVSFVLVVELVSGRWRTIVGILNILPVALTYVLTAGIAYFIRDWRTLQLVISLPWCLMLAIWFCVPESPRWLLANGRLDQLCALIERAARFNGTELSSNYRKSLEAVVPPEVRQPSSIASANEISSEVTPPLSQGTRQPDLSTSGTNPLVVVFGREYWRTTCLTLIVWLTLIIIYFGLTLHLSNLGGDIYVNTAIAGSVEAVSVCLSVFVVLKLGIRLNLIAYMLIPGICCLAANIVPKGDENLIYVISLAMIAKCIIGANNAIIPTYTAMQYPTVVRNFGVGMGNLAAGVALILVPYMWLLEHTDPLLPMSIMGVCGLIGAVALALMKDVRH